MLRVIRTLVAASALLGMACDAQTPPQAAQSGDGACLACHTQATSYLHTAHHATSALAGDALLAPLVRAAGHELTITGPPLPTLAFQIEEKNGHYSQTALSGWGSDLLHTSAPIDVVIGSDKRGQTFLSWLNDRLYELPVSYWKDGHRWINSPGYIDGTADFRRPVQPGCLECHATSIVATSTDASQNRYDRASLVTGISCRNCHGPGEAHIAVEEQAAKAHGHAAESKILNPAHFSRERQLDLCALCHSGIQRTALKPAFSYVPGEPLSQYFQPLPGADQAKPDVHGNQVGLLERSRCFRSSTTLTCSTCHDTHTASQPLESYAARCMTCHTVQSCGLVKKVGAAAIAGKCIGCHMPLQQTEAIISTTAGQRVQATMRTHWIKVYPEQAREQVHGRVATPKGT